MIHYQDLNHLGKDLKIVPLWEPIGHWFNFKTYEHKVSYPYYFSGIAKSTTKFKTNPQDVVILVKPYLHMQVLFKDVTDHNKVISRCDPLTRKSGVPMDYKQIGNQHMPAHYQFLKPIQSSIDSNNDSVSTLGGTEVIYIQPKRRSSNYNDDDVNSVKSSDPGPKLITGVLRYLNIDNGKLEKSIKINGPQGIPIHYSWYKQSRSVPRGFKFVGLGDRSNHYLVPNGYYVILVKSLKARPELHQNGDRSETVTGEILYQDVDQHVIRETQIVTGHLGQSLADYIGSNSKYVPKGYRFVKLLSNHGSKLFENAIYIVLIKSISSNANNSSRFNLSRGIRNNISLNRSVNDILAKISSSLQNLSVAVGGQNSRK